MIGALLLGAVVSTLPLDGEWSARCWPTPTEGSVRELTQVPSTAESLPAKVPGCIELDLEAAGRISDLHFGTNSLAMRAWEGHQWLYERKFKGLDRKSGERVFLCFEGLDTLADVFVNGQKVGEAKNYFLPHEFDVTGFVRSDGENEVSVLFRSVVMESQHRTYGVIGNAGVSGCELESVRKPAHMGGWDILPRMISCGIYRSCRLETRTSERVRDVFYVPLKVDAEKRFAEYFADVRLEGAFGRLDSTDVVLTLTRPGKQPVIVRKAVVNWSPRITFTVRDADLWWPRGFGEPALYDAKIEWVDRATGSVVAEDRRKIGLRTIRFRHEDFRDEQHPGEFLFIVNGKPCFIRGTNWVPVDPLPARAYGRILPTLEYIKELNCNMIRVWGGGQYEPEIFWDWCDANGVMVWQDFMMACTMYPQNDAEFLAEMRREVREVVLRLRNHAALALWAGNNENDSAFATGALRPYDVDPNKDVISRRIIPEVLFEFDPVHAYMPSSPYISPDAFALRTKVVEWHYYRRWWKSDLMTKSPVRFSSELGYHGMPCRKSLEKFIPAKDLYPWTSPAESNVLWKTVLSDYRPEVNLNSGAEAQPPTPPDAGTFVWNAQWKNRTVLPYSRLENEWYFPGRLDRSLLQIGMLFGKVELDLDDFIEQSQITQAEAMKFLMEYYRSRKFNGRNGMCWWNVREGWPTITECFVDYYGERKRAFDEMKVAQRDLLAMIDEDGSVILVNDTLKDWPCKVTVVDAGTGRVLFDGEGVFPANGVRRLGRIEFEGQGVARIIYEVRGQKLRNHYLYGKPPFNFAMVRNLLGKRGADPSER